MHRYAIFSLFLFVLSISPNFAQKRPVTVFELETIYLNTCCPFFYIETDLQKTLNSEKVSPRLCGCFLQNGVPLSSTSRIKARQLGKVWEVHDTTRHQKYTIFWAGERLVVGLADYPWWRELHLTLSGRALQICDKALLTVKIFYLNTAVDTFYFRITCRSGASRRFAFFRSWGPLNSARQGILPGLYRVETALELSRQSPQFRKLWKRHFPGKVPFTYRKKFTIGSKAQFIEITKQQRIFYLKRIKSLNRLFSLLQRNKKSALAIRRGGAKSSPFAVDGEFSAARWSQWLKKFYRNIETEKEILGRAQKSYFPQRFPITHRGMKDYCSALFRLSRAATMDVFEAYQVKYSRERLRHIDPGINYNFTALVRYIAILHKKSASELGVDLVKELGYSPPPVRSFYDR